MKTLVRSKWARIVIDGAVVFAVIVGATYFIAADVDATEAPKNVEPVTLTFQFQP